VAQLVERVLAKDKVAGSSPVFRSEHRQVAANSSAFVAQSTLDKSSNFSRGVK
jgi:hypothetical protein